MRIYLKNNPILNFILIQFETMHSIYRNSDRSPTYLADMVPAKRLLQGQRDVCDPERAVCSTYHVFVRNLVRQRSHSSGPSAWNALPTDIRDETCTAAFKRKLKTFYFSQAFHCIWFYFILFHPWQFVMHLRSFSSGGTTQISNL